MSSTVFVNSVNHLMLRARECRRAQCKPHGTIIFHAPAKKPVSQKMKLKLATWNIWTLLDSSRSCARPERRTALVWQVLNHYRIDIAALSETRLSDTGELEEVGKGYTVYWSGRAAGVRCEAGVGFVIKTTLVKRFHPVMQNVSTSIKVETYNVGQHLCSDYDS